MKRLTFSSPLGRKNIRQSFSSPDFEQILTTSSPLHRFLLWVLRDRETWEILTSPTRWRPWEPTSTCWRAAPRTSSPPTGTACQRARRFSIRRYKRYFNSISSFYVSFLRLHTNWRSCQKVTRRKSMKLRKSSTPSENWFGSQAPMLWDCIYMTRV